MLFLWAYFLNVSPLFFATAVSTGCCRAGPCGFTKIGAFSRATELEGVVEDFFLVTFFAGGILPKSSPPSWSMIPGAHEEMKRAVENVMQPNKVEFLKNFIETVDFMGSMPVNDG